MSTFPTTFRGEPGDPARFDWDEPASLHRSDDKGGLFNEFKSIRHGALADLVRQVMALPADERARYAIDKSGDHRLDHREIEKLAARPDFPES